MTQLKIRSKMKIDILVLEEDPKRFKKAVEFFRVRSLLKDLQEYQIFPKIVTSMEQMEIDTYYLLVLTRPYDSAWLEKSPSILIMGGSMSDVYQGSQEFNFAGICRHIHFRDRYPYLFGHPVVGSKMEVVGADKLEGEDLGKGEVFAVLQPKSFEPKGLIPFLLEYLKVYDELGLKHRSETVVKRI